MAIIKGDDTDNDLIGTAVADSIEAMWGNDTAYGGGGNDVLDGDGGDDRLYGDVGDDHLRGGDHADRLYGGEGNDTLTLGDFFSRPGDETRNWAYGGTGNDTFYGSIGHDKMVGSAGNDEFRTGGGNDTILAGGGQDVVIVNEADVVKVKLGAGTDAVSALYLGDIDNDGLFGRTEIYGGGGSDLLLMTQAEDLLKGGGGHDFLSGGGAQDDLYGGKGQDTFVFGDQYGADTVHDFSAKADRISLNSDLWTEQFGDLSKGTVVNRFAEVDRGDMILDFGNGDVLTIEDLSSKKALKQSIEIDYTFQDWSNDYI